VLDFFKNKWVKLVAWILLAVSAIVLIIGGVTQESLSGAIVLIVGVVSAISALVAFIIGQLNK
jgi:uncharacterized membrane protein